MKCKVYIYWLYYVTVSDYVPCDLCFSFGAVWEWLVAMAILIVAWVKGLFGA